MASVSESVLLQTRYQGQSNNFERLNDTERESYNGSRETCNKENLKETSRGFQPGTASMRRTHSCPLLFILKQDAMEGKKIRLSRGALEYLRNRQQRSVTRSFSHSDLATIKEGEDSINSSEADNNQEDTGCGTCLGKKEEEEKRLLSLSQKLSSGLYITDENRKEILEKVSKENQGGVTRVSRRALEKCAEEYYTARKNSHSNHSALPPLPQLVGQNTVSANKIPYVRNNRQNGPVVGPFDDSKVENKFLRNPSGTNHSNSFSREPDYYSMYHGQFSSKSPCTYDEPDAKYVEKNMAVGNETEQHIAKVETAIESDRTLMQYDDNTVNKSRNNEKGINENGNDHNERNNIVFHGSSEPFHPPHLDERDRSSTRYINEQLWKPPSVWKLPPDHQWNGHDVRTNEYGGWWTERWGSNLDKNVRFGDKYGVDNDGYAWAEWWLEKDLDVCEGGSTWFVKQGKRWGYNQKSESWMESWSMTANGTYYTDFKMIPPSEFLEL